MLFVRNFSLTVFVFCISAPFAMADQFHYQNVISGDRSMGLGGAYTGMSSDASGIVYNPAGMGFALSNDFQGSANALFDKKLVYKKAIGNDDFTEESEGQLAPFFGGLQKLDHISPGLVFGFGYYTTDSDLKDQDDTIVATNLKINSFRRTTNHRASTTYFGVAVAKRLNPKFSIGFGTNYIKVDELTQEYQDVVAFVGPGVADNTRSFYSVLTQNIRSRLLVNAIQPVIGIQVAPIPKLSLGLSIKYAFIVTENYELYQQSTKTFIDNQSKYVDKATDDAETTLDLGQGVIQGRTSGADGKLKGAMGEWPLEVRGGVTYFASPRFLATMDVIHYGKTKGKLKSLEREAITNFALGTEYYVTASVPLRFGLFSNYDTRPEPKVGKTGQADHVDFYGLSMFVGWVQPNSQIAAGIIRQQGTGKAQKIAGDTAMQDVEAVSNILALSITSTF